MCTGKDATRALVRVCLVFLSLCCTEMKFLYPHPLPKCLNFGRKMSNFFVNEIIYIQSLSIQKNGMCSAGFVINWRHKW